MLPEYFDNMEKSDKTTNKRTLTIIASLCLLIVSIVLLIVFLVIKNSDNSSANITLLRITANDITLNVGQSVEDYYTISNPDAKIDIEIDKQNIIQIDKTSITAIKSGIVKVTLTAVLDDATAKENFTVTVSAPDYSYQVANVQGGSFQNNTIYVSKSSPAAFKVDVYDKLGQAIAVSELDYTISSGIIQNQLGTFIVIADENCVITFTIRGIDYTFFLNVAIL